MLLSTLFFCFRLKLFTKLLFLVYRVDDDLEERQSLMKPKISSKKLRDLGFEYKYGIDEIIYQTIDASINFRFPTLDQRLKQ